MGDLTRPAVGARSTIYYGQETVFGQKATIDKVLRFTSESMSNEINAIVSNELYADRARHSQIRGSSSVGGDINVEQNVEGQNTLIKNALGNNNTVSSFQYVDGGIAAITVADFTSASDTEFDCDRDLIVEGFLSGGGQGLVVGRDNDGEMYYDTFEYSGIGGVGNITLQNVQAIGGGDLSNDYPTGARIFLRDSTNYDDVYTHVVDPARVLLPGVSFEILRDIALFTYTGVKVNTLTETFPENDVCTAVYSLLGRAEWALGLLEVAASPGDTQIELFSQEHYDGFPDPGGNPLKIQIGSETNITYTGKSDSGGFFLTGIPASGEGEISNSHDALEPVSIMESTCTAQANDTDPITSFMGAFYVGNATYEVMSFEWMINNNLFDGKFPLGAKYRTQLPEQYREVTGTATCEFDDLILYALYTEDIDAKIEVAIIDNRVEGEIGNTGVFRQKYIVFPRVKYSGSTPVAGGPDLIVTDFPFTALTDDANNLPEVYLVIVNSETSI